MRTSVEEEVILTNEQIILLKEIYTKRGRFLISAGLGMLLFWAQTYKDVLRICYEVYFVYPKGVFRVEAYQEINVAITVCSLILILILGFFIYSTTKKILPLRRDIKTKSGLLISKQIVRKSRPYLGKCFFFFDDLKTPYKEVNVEDYYNYQPGELYPFLVSKESKIQIDNFKNYELI